MTPLTVALVLALAALHVQAQDCRWSANYDLPIIQPLYINPSKNPRDANAFFMPQSTLIHRHKSDPKKDEYDDIVTMKKGENIIFACPGSKLTGSLSQKNQIELACHGGLRFENAQRVLFSIKDLACQDYPKHSVVKRLVENGCGPGKKSKLSDIGFQISPGFYSIMEICFNDTTLTADYSKFTKSKERNTYQKDVLKPEWSKPEGYYPAQQFDLSALYSRGGQFDSFTSYVGDLTEDYLERESRDAKGNIGQGAGFYLSRGHLTAMTDFFYGSHQRATFNYLNVAPQWQIINEGNWKTMETNYHYFTAKYATQNSRLDIYTGTHGLLRLRDINKYPVGIFLGLNPSKTTHRKNMWVPKYFWRVIYDPANERGIALVGLNNPYETKEHHDARVAPCNSICDRVPWIQWDAANKKLGYSYCCKVDELALKFTGIPALKVSGIIELPRRAPQNA